MLRGYTKSLVCIQISVVLIKGSQIMVNLSY